MVIEAYDSSCQNLEINTLPGKRLRISKNNGTENVNATQWPLAVRGYSLGKYGMVSKTTSRETPRMYCIKMTV